jgi:type I restriction enzyme, S subunit
MQLRAMAHSTDMAPYLSLADQWRLHISLPPISEQNAIADVLGTLDDKIVVNERIGNASLELAKYWYQRACTDESGLRELSIEDIAEIFDGPHATPTKTLEGPWFLSISSLKRGRLDLAESAHVTRKDFAKWTRRTTPRAGDLLFSYETRLGEAALMPEGIQGCLGRRMALMRPRAGLNSLFLLFAYLGREFQETIRRRAVYGATVDRIPLTELPSWPIRILDWEDRRSLTHVLGELNERMLLSERESSMLRELRDTLLPQLLSGGLRVRDAERVAEEVA